MTYEEARQEVDAVVRKIGQDPDFPASDLGDILLAFCTSLGVAVVGRVGTAEVLERMAEKLRADEAAPPPQHTQH